MKEKPILFSGPMVRAILDGTKTQTRRVARLTSACHVKEPRGHRRWHPGDPDAVQACPYGQTGDALWVRETWKPTGLLSGAKPRATKGCGRFAYAADAEQLPRDEPIRWRPSIHMPRWASRLTLRVTGVRIERLRDISEDDARAEGVGNGPRPGKVNGEPATIYPFTHRQAFIWLWDSINDKRHPWASNPWVWVLNFDHELCPLNKPLRQFPISNTAADEPWLAKPRKLAEFPMAATSDLDRYDVVGEVHRWNEDGSIASVGTNLYRRPSGKWVDAESAASRIRELESRNQALAEALASMLAVAESAGCTCPRDSNMPFLDPCACCVAQNIRDAGLAAPDLLQDGKIVARTSPKRSVRLLRKAPVHIEGA